MVGSLEDKINVEIAFKTTGSTTAAKEIERLKKELRGIQRDFMGPAASMKAALTDPLKEQIRLLQEQQARVKKFNDEKLREINIAKKGAADYKRMMTDVNLFGDELQWKKRQKAIKDANKEMRRFKGEWLSLMFLGMAIQRTFGGILRASYQTFSKATEGTNKANNAVTRLNASWEFFKFALIDSLLSNPLFSMMIDWVAGMVDWLSELTYKTDGWLTAIIGVAAAIGGILATAGMLHLGINQMSVGALLDEAKTIGPKVQKAAGTIMLAYGLIQTVESVAEFESGNWLESSLKVLGAGLMSVGGIIAFSNPVAGGALFAIGFELKHIADKLPQFKAFILAFAEVLGRAFGDLMGGAFYNVFIGNISHAMIDIANMIKNVPFMGGVADALFAGADKVNNLKRDLVLTDFYDELNKLYLKNLTGDSIANFQAPTLDNNVPSPNDYYWSQGVRGKLMGMTINQNINVTTTQTGTEFASTMNDELTRTGNSVYS
jgi:hypothetical protein